MRMNKKKEIVPKLRFPEFSTSEGWKKYKLRELADRITKKVGDNKLVTLSISAGIGFVSQAEKFSRDISGKQYCNYIYLKRGEFSYNKGNSKTFPQGCIYELKEYDEAAVPNAFISFRFKENLVPSFYQGYFDSNFHGKQLVRFITSGARSDGLLNISPTDFFSIVLPSPVKKEEQQKIANCLSSIDELIEAESRKLKALEKYKKGLMQKLFPAEGKTLPEWRFPEFSDGDGWIKTSLSQICIMQAGKFINASEISDEQENNMYPCYGGNGLRGYTLTHNCSGDHPLIGRQGALCGNVTFATGDFYATEHAIVVTANKNIDEKWLYYLLDYLQLNQYATGQAQPGLSVQTLEKVTAIYPGEVEEQKKIANCLSEIDAIIAEQSNKVERLKAHKKGLLQGLFPSLKEADV